MFPFPDDVRDECVHRSVRLCASGRAYVIPATSLRFLPQKREGSLDYPELCEPAGHPQAPLCVYYETISETYRFRGVMSKIFDYLIHSNFRIVNS